MPCIVRAPSLWVKQVTFDRSHKADYRGIRNVLFYLSPAYSDGYVALSSMALYSGSNSGNMDNAGLIGSLILVNLIK